MLKRQVKLLQLVQTGKPIIIGKRQTVRYYLVLSVILMAIGILVGDSSRSFLYYNCRVPCQLFCAGEGGNYSSQ
jgi:hypothetical protein